MRWRMATAVSIVLAVATTWGQAAAAAAPGLAGTWLSASGNVEVRVAPCGAKLCGAITRVFSNQSMSHPGKAIVGAPGVGTMVLRDLAAKPGGTWEGKIFNRENGKTYSCRITLPNAGRMQVRAYVGLPLFGQTQVWRRVG